MPTQITEEQGVHKAWYEEAKKIHTPEELTDFVDRLRIEYAHDYGTICHAIAAAAVGAAWCVAHGPEGGITGFQASCIMWEFIRHWSGPKGPARMIDYELMLYPQYAKSFTSITQETADWVKKAAQEKLDANNPIAHPEVKAHWERLASGIIPFGLTVED